jgi:hypothetical protein
MRIFAGEYLPVCEYLQANIRFNVKFAVLQIFASKQIFGSKYSPVSENLKQIFAATRIFLHHIEYLYANLSEYFEANDSNK